MTKGRKTRGDSAMIAEKASVFFKKKGVDISVRADRHGCSIYSEPEHRPIARLRIEGKGSLKFPFPATCVRKRGISPLKIKEKVEVVGMPPTDECDHEFCS